MVEGTYNYSAMVRDAVIRTSVFRSNSFVIMYLSRGIMYSFLITRAELMMTDIFSTDLSQQK